VSGSYRTPDRNSIQRLGGCRIWEYAGEHGSVVASKDSDFRQLAFLHGPPPKVVWLRVGNASTSTVLRTLLDHIQVMEAFALSEDEALLVLPGMPA
jgi:predicted nuclease of predicted toxin-antitoxin system